MVQIRVGRDCWIGSNITILKGVTIGAGCLICNNISTNSMDHSDGKLLVRVKNKCLR